MVAGVASIGVAGDSVTVLAVGDEATTEALAVGDLADPLGAWQAVQSLRPRGLEQPHAVHDQMPVFRVSPLPYVSEFLFRRRSSRAVGSFLLLSVVPTLNSSFASLERVDIAGDAFFIAGDGWLSGISITSFLFLSSFSSSDSLSATMELALVACDAETMSSTSSVLGGHEIVLLRLADELTLLGLIGCCGVLGSVASIFSIASDVMGSMDSARRFRLAALPALVNFDGGGVLGGSSCDAPISLAPVDCLRFTLTGSAWLTGKNGRSSMRCLLT